MKQLEANKDGNHNSLLVGKVQSGKTSNLELLTALAFDNGYNFLVIFGGYDTDLLKQSTERFGSTFETTGGEEVLYSETPVLFTTNDLTKESLSINSLNPDFAKQLIEEKRPIIITCLKRPPAMKAALKAIANIQETVSGIVPFIIDDEGDQASLNTAKDKARNSTPTYKHIVKIKEVLHNPLYLSVTATPQANIFQEDISELNPASIHTVQPGNGYDGASVYHLSENQIVEEVEDSGSLSLISNSLNLFLEQFSSCNIEPLFISKQLTSLFINFNSSNCVFTLNVFNLLLLQTSFFNARDSLKFNSITFFPEQSKYSTTSESIETVYIFSFS
jgi:hypothetical protein